MVSLLTVYRRNTPNPCPASTHPVDSLEHGSCGQVIASVRRRGGQGMAAPLGGDHLYRLLLCDGGRWDNTYSRSH